MNNSTVNFLQMGWIIRKYEETKIPPEFHLNACFERFTPFDNILLPESVKQTVQNLAFAFPDFKIEMREIHRIFGRSFEIEGRSLKPEENKMFWTKLTAKKIYVKIYGIECDRVLRCLGNVAHKERSDQAEKERPWKEYSGEKQVETSKDERPKPENKKTIKTVNDGIGKSERSDVVESFAESSVNHADNSPLTTDGTLSKKGEVLYQIEPQDLIVIESSCCGNWAKKAIADNYRSIKSDITIFLQGEPGVGKTRLAYLFHEISGRKNKPCDTIDCANILGDDKAYSELFGHEKGAYTGAYQQHIGIFERTNGGTVFIENIEHLPKRTQDMLNILLSEKYLIRMQGEKHIDIDVRIIVTSAENLDRMVKRGDFSNQLYRRIKTQVIIIPPLRERRGEIPGLIEHFINKYSGDKKVTNVSTEVFNFAKKYSWPANVGDLEEKVKRAVIDAEGNVISLESLLKGFQMNSEVEEIYWLYGKKYSQLDDTSKKILSRWGWGNKVDTHTISEEYGCTRQALWPHLTKLEREGFLEKIGETGRGGSSQYRIKFPFES